MTHPTIAPPPPLFLFRAPEPPHVAAEAMPIFTEAARAHLANGTRAGLERWLPTADELVERHSKPELQEMARAADVSTCGSKPEIAARLVIA